jgi:uncharacterized protein YggU (UPF0235/DUF167 family)
MNISVKVRAGAKVSRVERISDSEVRIWVPTAPEKGKANTAVKKLLAKEYNVSPSSLTLLKGHTSPQKLFELKNHNG